jgi:hypothetical protein
MSTIFNAGCGKLYSKDPALEKRRADIEAAWRQPKDGKGRDH